MSPALEVTLVPVTPFQQNCTVLRCTATGRGAIVDPGGEPERIVAAIREQHMEPEKILLTHAHIDHAGATAQLARELELSIEGPHREDLFWIESLPQQGTMFGIGGGEVFEPDRWFEDEDRTTVGEVELRVRHCPGHTPGHVVFFDEADGLALVGDCLFAGSIGRTDFPRGDHATLIRSIRERLLTLGDEVTFVPGHGPTSTFGHERRTNPFLVGETGR